MSEPQVNQLSQDQVSTFRSLFDLIDQNHDGKISLDDLKKTYSSIGEKSTDDDLQKMLPSGESTLEFPTFLKLMASKFSKFSDEQDLKDAFGIFNKQGEHTGIVCESKDIGNAIMDVSKRSQDDAEKISAKEIKDVLKDFSSKNDMTGKSNFNASKFIETIKN